MNARIAWVKCVYIADPRFTKNHCIEVSCLNNCISGYLSQFPLCFVQLWHQKSFMYYKMPNRRQIILGMLPNVMQLHSLASCNLLFREYGSIFFTPGVLKNDQKVVVQESRLWWMTGILSLCLNVRGLRRQEL